MGVGHGDGYYTCTGTKTAVPVHRSFGDGQIQLPAGLSLYEVAVPVLVPARHAMTTEKLE